MHPRDAFAASEELAYWYPDSTDESTAIKEALADNPNLPAWLLVRLVDQEFAAAAATLIAKHPRSAWQHLDPEDLTFVAGLEGGVWGRLGYTPATLPWPARIAMYAIGACHAEDLLALAEQEDAGSHQKPDGGEQPRAEVWQFADVAEAILEICRQSYSWDDPAHAYHPAVSIAEHPLCDAETATSLLRERATCARTTTALACNQALPTELRLKAMQAAGQCDHPLPRWFLRAGRAQALGRALLRAGNDLEQLARLAEQVDTADDDVIRTLRWDGEASVVAETLAAMASANQ